MWSRVVRRRVGWTLAVLAWVSGCLAAQTWLSGVIRPHWWRPFVTQPLGMAAWGVPLLFLGRRLQRSERGRPPRTLDASTVPKPSLGSGRVMTGCITTVVAGLGTIGLFAWAATSPDFERGDTPTALLYGLTLAIGAFALSGIVFAGFEGVRFVRAVRRIRAGAPRVHGQVSARSRRGPMLVQPGSGEQWRLLGLSAQPGDDVVVDGELRHGGRVFVSTAQDEVAWVSVRRA